MPLRSRLYRSPSYRSPSSASSLSVLVLAAFATLATLLFPAVVHGLCPVAADGVTYLCCDQLLWSAASSSASPWEIRNLMVEDSQGPTSGDLSQWKSAAPPRFESPRVGNTNLQGRISFSSVNAPGDGVVIPDLIYIATGQRPAVWLDTFGSGSAAKYQGCSPWSDCAPQDGIAAGIGFDGWDGAIHTAISPDLDGYAYTKDCSSPPCWTAPTPAIGLPNKRSMLGSQDLSGTCNRVLGNDRNCAGERIYPRWMVTTHDTKGWFTGATQFTISGGNIWGCVQPTGLFHTIEPCRLYDSRRDRHITGKIEPIKGPRRVTAHGSCGIPYSARSLVGNITIVNAQRAGHLKAYRGDLSTEPATYTVSFAPGQTRAAMVTVEIDGTGAFYASPDVFGISSGDFVVDVTGYFE